MVAERHPNRILKAAIIAGGGVLFLLVTGGLAPTHLAHDHPLESDHSHPTCDLCLKIAANPALAPVAATAPVSERTGSVASIETAEYHRCDIPLPCGRAPPVPAPEN